MEELSDDMIRSAQKDDTAFRMLYEHYSPYVWRIIFRTVHGNNYLAESILQNVFIIVYRKLSKFKGDSAFATWLYQIAWRESLRKLKKEKKKRERNQPLHENIQLTNHDDFHEEIDLLLSALTEEERFLLVSRELDGFSFDDLTLITGKSNGSLRTTVSRIKQKIREASHEK